MSKLAARGGRTKPRKASGRGGGGRARLLLGAAVVALVGVGVALGGGGGSDEPAGGVAVGATAPVVQLPATSGNTVDLADFRGKRNVLLYFYEHAG